MIHILLLTLIGFICFTLLYYAYSGPGESWDPDLDSDALTTLGRQKDKLLRILKDLDEEREMGSIEEGEHLQLRRSYKAKAVIALREYDRVRDARLRRLRDGGAVISPDLLLRIEKKAALRLRQLYARKGEG